MDPILVRSRVRDQVRDLVREMISSGQLRDGERLEEVSLSGRIGVSRTPLREALIALEADGFVHSTPNKGFAVTPANTALVREIYPILAALECAAMRLSGDALIALATHLREVNDRFLHARSKAQQYELDALFHQLLTGSCGNPRLLRLLDAQRAMARRFDGAHWRGAADRKGSHREHAEIVAALASGDIERGVSALAAHWRGGEETVVRWLGQRS